MHHHHHQMIKQVSMCFSFKNSGKIKRSLQGWPVKNIHRKHKRCSEVGCGHCIAWKHDPSSVQWFWHKYKNTQIHKYKYKYKYNLKIVKKIGQHSLQGIAVKIKRSLQGSPVKNTHEMLRMWMRSLVWTRAMGFLDLQSFQFFLLKITKMQKYKKNFWLSRLITACRFHFLKKKFLSSGTGVSLGAVHLLIYY